MTIEDVSAKPKFGQEIGSLELDWFLKLREFKKWMKLKVISAEQIMLLLGTDESEEWKGQTIGIFPVMIQIANQDPPPKWKHMWVINVDAVKPTTQPQLPPNADISGYGSPQATASISPAQTTMLPGSAEATPIGLDAAAAMVGWLAQRGKRWDDFLQFMRDVGQDRLVAGRSPPDCPGSIREWAMKYGRQFPQVKPPPTEGELARLKSQWAPAQPAGEVVDKTTGEVITPAAVGAAAPSVGRGALYPAPVSHVSPPRSAAAPAPAHHPPPATTPVDDTNYQPIEEEDIPF